MNELYVTGVVIPNGVADHEGDVLNKKDILKIFTKYTERATDTMHTKIKNKGVDVLANWISETDQKIAGKIAPAGSWLATLKISNNEIIKSIQDGNIQGISLGSIPDFALTNDFWFVNKSIEPRTVLGKKGGLNYSDLEDAEQVIPLFISLVDKPSNQYGLEIMDYDIYINKRAKNDIMTEEKQIDEKVSMSTLEKIIDLFSLNKSETPVEEVEITKEETAVEEPEQEVKADLTNEELLAQIDEKINGISDSVTAGVVSAFEKLPEVIREKQAETKAETEEEVEPEKEDVADKTEEVEVKKTETKTDDVEINKRQTTKTENVETVSETNFYKLSGRDSFGCRIKK